MAKHADGTIVINTAIETDGFKKGSKDMEAAFRKAAHNLEGVSEKIQISIEKSVQAFEKQNAAYREQEVRVESLKAKIEEAQSEKVESQAFADINKQIDDYQKKLDAAIEKEVRFMETGGNTDSAAFIRMEYDIQMLRKKIAEAKAEKDRLLQSGEAYTGADISGLTSQLADAQDKLGQMGGKLEVAYASLREKLDEYTSTEQEAATATAEATTNTAQAATATEEMSAEVGQAAEKSNIFAQAFERIKAVFATIGAIPQSVRESTAALEESLGIVSQVSGESEQAAESIGEMADETERAAGTGGGFSGVYERVKNTMNNAAGAVKKFSAGVKGSGNSLKKFMKYGLGIATVYSLFNKLRSAIKDGIKNIVQFDKKTNTSISGIQSAFTKLKNNLAAAIAPLINTLAPYIIKVVNWLNKAITQLSIFLAQLTGQTTYIEAKDVWQDYAQSLRETSAAAKEAKKNLSGLDEIKTWDSGSSGSGSSSGTKVDDMFITKELDSSLLEIDWENLGEKISDGFIKGLSNLSNWLENIDWSELGANIGKALKDIDWRGMFASWEDFFDNFAEGVSNVLDSLIYELTDGKVDLPSYKETKEKNENYFKKLEYIQDKFFSERGRSEYEEYWGKSPSWLEYLQVIVDQDKIDELYEKFKKAESAARDNKIFGVLEDNQKVIEKLRSMLLLTEQDVVAINALIADSGQEWDVYTFIEKAYERGYINYELYRKALIKVQNEFESFEKGQEEINKRAAANAKATSNAIKEALEGTLKKALERVKNGGNTAGESFRDGFTTGLKKSPSALVTAGEYLAGGVSGSAAEKSGDAGEAYATGFALAIDQNGAAVLTAGTNLAANVGKGVTAGSAAVGTKLVSGIGAEVNSTTNQSAMKRTGSALGSILGSGITDSTSRIWASLNLTLSRIRSGFISTFNGIKTGIKAPINGTIGFINKLISGMTEGLNSVIKAMNNLSFDIPDWVPGLGGKSFGFDIKLLPVKKIPLLASGAVIPPNAPFTAVLGDQKHGTNIEAPLETIKQALREVLGSGTGGGGNTYNITATANGKTLFQLLLEEGRNAQMQTGKNPFLLA